MRLSKSRINSFKFCKFQYFMSYVKRWKPEIQPLPLKTGIAVHDGIDIASKECNSTESFKEEIQKLEDYTKYQKHYDNIIRYQDWNKLPLMHEAKFYDEELEFTGIIDRLQVTKDGDLAVMDYKTGKSHDIKYYTFELNIYAYLIKKLTGLMPTKGIIIFTKEGMLSDELTITEQTMNNAVIEVEAYRGIIAEAEEKGLYPRCGRCNVCKEFPTDESVEEWEKSR